MSELLVLVSVLGALAVGIAAGLLLGRGGRPSAAAAGVTVDDSVAEMVALDLLHKTRDEAGMPRLLVEVVDQGSEVSRSMRWRWLVWDADKALRLAAYPRDEADPQRGLGVEQPYMLGNTSTEAFATINAARWCRDRGANAFVLARPEGGGE